MASNPCQLDDLSSFKETIADFKWQDIVNSHALTGTNWDVANLAYTLLNDVISYNINRRCYQIKTSTSWQDVSSKDILSIMTYYLLIILDKFEPMTENDKLIQTQLLILKTQIKTVSFMRDVLVYVTSFISGKDD